ncbi:acyl carrier protein [Maribacter luteus]|uniref:Acyl carrier protein n=1 Tax=Maribacter luteus TaxID=2594478 RepID=A0A6I2MMN5_9FLAO|nr:acyl carrier protein [Maribacter luteus]MRX63750.1 acyl carrier protein [Maribacter luteus]|tara:strand:- start:89 stop:304 length:216 start_codon:yes stop_codon:yes gene_type:complete
MEKYLSTITEFLEVDSVDLNDSLTSFESWDSMTILMVIDFCAGEYGISLSADEIENSETILGLKELIDSKL